MENEVARSFRYHFYIADSDHCTEYTMIIFLDKDGNIVKASNDWEEDNGFKITDSGFMSMEKGEKGFEDFVLACIERIREKYKMKKLLGAINDETHKKYF